MGSIEEIFKKAAEEVEKSSCATPPPTADWSTMSSSLKESVLMKTGGIAKITVLNVLGTKIGIGVLILTFTALGIVGSAIYLSNDGDPSKSIENAVADPIVQEPTSNTKEKFIQPNELSSKSPFTSSQFPKTKKPQSSIRSEVDMNVKNPMNPDIVFGSLNSVSTSTIQNKKEKQTISKTASSIAVSNSNPTSNVEHQSGIARAQKSTFASSTNTTEEPTMPAQIGSPNENVSINLNNSRKPNTLVPKDLSSKTENIVDVFISPEKNGANLDSLPRKNNFVVTKSSRINDTLGSDRKPFFTPDQLMNAAAEDKIAGESDKSTWLIRPYFSIDLGEYREGVNTLANPITIVSSDVNLNSGPFNFTSGILAAYHLAPFLWIESGFLYSQKNEISGRMGVLDANFQLIKVVDYHLSGKYLEVPVHLMIKDNNGVFGYYAKAGMHMAFSYSESSNYIDIHDFEIIKTFRVEPSIQTFIPVISLGLGLEYNLNNSLRIFAEPNFRYSTKSVLNASEVENVPINPKWHTFGLAIGLNYYFD